MNGEQLQRLGLLEGVGFKVVNTGSIQRGTERCFFRYIAELKLWKNYHTGLTYNAEQAARILAYEIKYGELVFVMCSCPDCQTKENKDLADQFHKITGEFISNGVWPEHLARFKEVYGQV